MVLPLLQSKEDRFVQIIEHFSIPFCMMSLSYEPIFLMIMSQNLKNWMRIERLPFDQMVYLNLNKNIYFFIIFYFFFRYQPDSHRKMTILNEPMRSYPFIY